MIKSIKKYLWKQLRIIWIEFMQREYLEFYILTEQFKNEIVASS